MYLSPFGEDKIRSVYELYRICDILDLVAPSLKRLVLRLNIDTTMINCLGEKRGPVHQSFSHLTSLEIFCSVHFSLLTILTKKHGNFVQEQAWKDWPKLRVLALFDSAPNEQAIWNGWGAMEGLGRLILSHCEVFSRGNIQRIPEREFQHWWRESQKYRAVQRSMELVIVSAHEDAGGVVPGEENREEGDSLQFSRCTLVLREDTSIEAKVAAYERQVVTRILDGYETPEQ